MATHGTRPSHNRANTTLDFFEHDQLHSARDQIRLLQFAESGSSWKSRLNKKKTLSFTLCAHLRDNCPPYIAISYTWGSIDNPAEIIVNGKLLTIRRNLSDFLEVLSQQKSFKQSCFWIDQICINQSDNEERSLQVERMDQVYQIPEKVFAWLGKSTTEHDFVWHTLCRSKLHQRAKRGEHEFEYKVEEGDKPKFLSFLTRDYWHRLWIVQEVLLAQNLEFWYGGKHNDGVVVLDTISRLPKLQFEGNPTDVEGKNKYSSKDAQQTLKSLAQTKLEYEKSIPQLYLRRAIGNYWEQLCSDSRDLVFGVQALVKQEQRIRVDYTQTGKEVFQSAIKVILSDLGTATWTSMNPKSRDYFIKLDSDFAIAFWEKVTRSPAPSELEYNIEALSWSRKVCLLPAGSWSTYDCVECLKRYVTPAQKRLVDKCYELLGRRARTTPACEPSNVDPQSYLGRYPLPYWIEYESDGSLKDELLLLFHSKVLDNLKDIIFEAGSSCGFTNVDGFLVHEHDPHPDHVVSWNKPNE